MKKLNVLKKLSIFVLLFSMIFGNVLPVFAARDEDSETVETSEDDTERDIADEDSDESDEEAYEAIDVDFSSLKIGDQFKDYEGITYTVDDLSSTIYVGSGSNQETYDNNELPNFQITYTNDDGVTTWRKYVKLDDLCNVTKKDGTHICEIMDSTDEDSGKFHLKRTYKEKIYSSNARDMNFEGFDEPIPVANADQISLYYYSYHNIGEKRFEAILELVNEDTGEEVDIYKFDPNENIDYQGTWSNEKNKSILTTDIETLKDKNGVVYVSLRFVSESLGAEVTWVPEKESRVGDDDEVIIKFYDDKEYCKDINFTITGDSGKDSRDQDPKDIEKVLYTQKATSIGDISFDGEYTYTGSNGKKYDSTIDWKNVYILLTEPESYDKEFEGNITPLSKNIFWKKVNGKYILRAERPLYGELSSPDGQCQVGEYTINCNQGEKIDITGIIIYSGVPIPIDLFNINEEYEKCEKEDTEYKYDSKDDDEVEEESETSEEEE